MISLTILQAFITDALNLIEISIIYRLLVHEIKPLYIIMDCFVSLMIVSIPIQTSTVQLILIVTYFWLNDRVTLHPNIITNSIIGLLCASIIPLTFDIMDHITFNLIKQQSIHIFGWLIPLIELIFTVIIVLLIKQTFTIEKYIQWFEYNFQKSFQLWRLTIIFFLGYITLSIISEQEEVANKYALLMFAIYFEILLVGGIDFISFIRIRQQEIKKHNLVQSYKMQIEYIQQLNKQYENFRRERHDIKNLLLNIQGYVQAKDFEKSNQLLNDILNNKDDDKVSIYVDHALSKLKIAGIRNIIKEKSYQIIENHIPLSIEINTEITSIPGSEIITSRIIGILLDNALEATIKQKSPFIQLAILKYHKNSLELTISNSLEHSFDINKAMIIGKTEKQGHQGIGLPNVSKLVSSDNRYSFSVEVRAKKVVMSCFIQEGNSTNVKSNNS